MGPEAQSSPPEPRKRGHGPGFPKGKSGNPGGRPKAVKALVEAARKLTPKAIEVLKAALDSEDERVRMQAVHEALDRGWGKAAQSITGPDGEKLTLAIAINLGGED